MNNLLRLLAFPILICLHFNLRYDKDGFQIVCSQNINSNINNLKLRKKFEINFKLSVLSRVVLVCINCLLLFSLANIAERRVRPYVCVIV